MASISRDPNGRKTIQFVASDGKRKSVRLGKVSQRIAEEIKVKVESLNAAVITGCPVDSEPAQWVARLGEDLAGKLAAAGLIPRRAAAKLADFLDGYITRRTDIKPRTRFNLEVCRARLVEFSARIGCSRASRRATRTPSCSGSRNAIPMERPGKRLAGRNSFFAPPLEAG